MRRIGYSLGWRKRGRESPPPHWGASRLPAAAPLLRGRGGRSGHVPSPPESNASRSEPISVSDTSPDFRTFRKANPSVTSTQPSLFQSLPPLTAIKLGKTIWIQPRRGVRSVAPGAAQRNPGWKCAISPAASGNARSPRAPTKPETGHDVGGLRRERNGWRSLSLAHPIPCAICPGVPFALHPRLPSARPCRDSRGSRIDSLPSLIALPPSPECFS